MFGSMRDLRKARGYHYEHKLHKMLVRKKYHIWRSPCSGSRELPDLFGVHKRKQMVIAIEVKSTGCKSVEVGRYQIKKLFDFVNAFPKSLEKKCVVAIWFRYKSTGWRFYEVKEIKKYVFTIDDESTFRF